MLSGKTGGIVEGAPVHSILSFEQQKELLLLQMQHDKMKCEAEQARISLEWEKLSLYREGRLSMEAFQALGGESGSSCGRSSHFDIVGSLKLVPKFNEQDSFNCLKEWRTLGVGLVRIARLCYSVY